MHSVVFGTTLGTILKHAGVGESKRAAIIALKHAIEFFKPVAGAFTTMGGEDRPFLAAGMASQTVVRAQRRALPECTSNGSNRTYVERNGYGNIVIGAVGSLLLANHLATVVGGQESSVVLEALEKCCEATIRVLNAWSVRDAHGVEGGSQRCALDAERRAVERAHRAGMVARTNVRDRQVGDQDLLRHVIYRMKLAAWPPGTAVGASTQDAMMKTIASQVSAPFQRCMPPPLPLVPLAALSNLLHPSDPADSSDSSLSGGSHTSSSYLSASTDAEDEHRARIEELVSRFHEYEPAYE
jgi:hypothetical protein